MSFNDVLSKMNDVMYTYILIILLIGVGVYFTIRTKGVQFRLLKDGIKSMLERSEVDEDGNKKVSSFHALMISTASRVGTGNIAGIATAIAAGGPGAVSWTVFLLFSRQSAAMSVSGEFISLPSPFTRLRSAV